MLIPFLILFFLAACKNNQPENQVQNSQTTINQPLDLTGNWEQTNKNSETNYQKASITGETIEIYWINTEDDTKSLYWSGTYVAPTSGVSEHTWDSKNNKEKTKSSLLASNDDTKKFSYEKGVISYDMSAMGVTKTVKLERVNS